MRENAVCRCNQRLTSTRKVFPPVRNMVVSLAWGALRYSLFLPIRPHPLSATGGGCVRIIRPHFARPPVSPAGSVGASACGRGVRRTSAVKRRLMAGILKCSSRFFVGWSDVGKERCHREERSDAAIRSLGRTEKEQQKTWIAAHHKGARNDRQGYVFLSHKNP